MAIYDINTHHAFHIIQGYLDHQHELSYSPDYINAAVAKLNQAPRDRSYHTISLLRSKKFTEACSQFNKTRHSLYDTIDIHEVKISPLLLCTKKIAHFAANLFKELSFIIPISIISLLSFIKPASCFLAAPEAFYRHPREFFTNLSDFRQKYIQQNNEGAPVILVHGYLSDQTKTWALLREQLRKSTKSPIYSFDYRHSTFDSVHNNALRLKAMVEQVKKKTGNNDVYIVGHSLGGLISSYYTQKFTTPKEAPRKVITICSPLHGTVKSKLGLGQASKDMATTSDTIAFLQKELKYNPLTDYYHIAANDDIVVQPINSALMALQPEREHIFENCGHTSILWNVKVAKWIASKLNT
ncbi:MAG: esterase/lipase family protein [Chlamydiota bacterium]